MSRPQRARNLRVDFLGFTPAVNNALAATLAEGPLLEHDAVLTHPEDKQSLQNILAMARRIQHSIDTLVNVTHAPVTDYVEGVSMIDLKQVTSTQRPQH